MTQTVGNIVLPGPCLIYVAPHSTSSLEPMPTSSIAKATAWGGNWVEVGFTKGGVKLIPETEYLEVEVDQANAVVADAIIGQKGRAEFVCSEATLTQIKQAMGHGTVTAGSTESTLGISGADHFPTYYSVGFEIYAPNATAASAKYRRGVIWKARPGGAVEIKGEKKEEQLVAYTVDARYEAQAAASERLWKLIDRQN